MKNWRLLLWSLGAFAIYFLFKYAPLYKGTFESLENSNSSRYLLWLIFIKIAGWFLLLFGT